MNGKIQHIASQSLRNEPISRNDALYLMQIDRDEIYDLFYWANQIRLRYFGHSVKACSIVSARQGRCTEDCSFCSQSARYHTGIEEFPLVDTHTILDGAKCAEQAGATSLGIVTSGYGISNSGDLHKICDTIEEIARRTHIHPHGSFGILTRETAESLVKCGLKRLNHNLETSERFFPTVCSTHTFSDRMNTIRIAKEVGLEICSGAIFGIGEGIEDRIDLAFTLKDLDVNVVPINFLHPISGTPQENSLPLTPMEALKIISVFRFILPDKEIKIAGGRERNLRDLQSWMFYAGVNSTMIGNYLTTTGRKVEDDFRMIKDLGLDLTSNQD
ncbi:MAG: biotin synthase BioB [Candidatus Brocadia carolinensis]|uniref:Biotin synthase n=1 Tax=Candidatus Brocadia carolinensis TaxID=1004156 RepID=A0A1V4AQM8_9BACT|nr:MAG: biotin synthase BioB [Candidatus Brocadia caroliniensis]